MKKGISDFLKLAYKYNKVKNLEEAFKEFPVTKEWHKGKIENILKDNENLIFNSDSIKVIDDAIGRLYTPFYESEKGFDYLNNVIIQYNNCMDELATKNIFTKKNEKVLVKK